MDTYIITGANGDIGISMAELLRERYKNLKIIGTDISYIWPAKAFFDDIELISKANCDAYRDDLDRLVLRYQPKYIIPTSEPELRWIAHNRDKFLHLPLLMNDQNLILTCMDKLESIYWLRDKEITVPKTTLLSEARAADLPLIIKPRYGAGSRGIMKIISSSLLDQAKIDRDIDNVAQEFLDAEDEEYTCALVRLTSGSQKFVMKRKLKEGVTFEMKGIRNSLIEVLLDKIAEHLPLHSAINVQLRLTEKGPMVFEINPRFSSTIKMRHMLGFSDFLWLLDDMDGIATPNIDPMYNKNVYRVYREVLET